MSKGKFQPGRQVLLLGEKSYPEHWANKHIGELHELESYADAHARAYHFPCWYLKGVGFDASPIARGAWRQSHMILINPDEIPEQSIEAMRDLMQTKKEKVTT